jgi:hypothetical protein
MKNITVSIDEKTHHLACIHAAKLDTSVAALVEEYLKNLASDVEESERERRRRRLKEVVADITANNGGLRMADNLPREELYDRARARAEAEKARRLRDRDA